jgi:nitrate reductase gamma subunit
MILTAIIGTGFSLFLIGIVIRIARIAAMPVHVRWELYPIPNGAIGKTRVMLSEIFLLKGVFEQNRPLWIWSWIFHISLYLLIGVACLSLVALISEPLRDFMTFGIAILAGFAYACGAVGSSGLILTRLISPRLRPFTSFGAFFNLALLLAIFLSGLATALLQPAAANVIVEQAESFLLFHPPPPLHLFAAIHLVLIALVAAYFPWTQMAHAVLKYFTYHLVRWDDRPADRTDADRMRRYLAFPVSWSAPHIQGGNRRSWMDLVKAKDTNTNGMSG